MNKNFLLLRFSGTIKVWREKKFQKGFRSRWSEEERRNEEENLEFEFLFHGNVSQSDE